MSSKLKMRNRAAKIQAPMSNKAYREWRMSACATKEHLENAEKEMKKKIYSDVYKQLHEEIIPQIREDVEQTAWNESDDWTTVINTCTFLTALQDLHGFSRKRMMRLIQHTNNYVAQINEGKLQIMDLINNLEKRHKIMFDDEYKELVKRYQDERITN